MRTFKLRVTAAALLMAASISAHAALVTTPFTGTIEKALAGNPFGVGVGDTVFASATYDDALVAATGISVIEIDSNPAFDLRVTIGSTVITADQDIGYGFGYPRLEFTDGLLTGVDIRAQFDLGLFVMEFGTLPPGMVKFYLDALGSEAVLEGTFVLPPAPVPIPPAIFLFGTALAGLAVIGRRLPLPLLRSTEPAAA